MKLQVHFFNYTKTIYNLLLALNSLAERITTLNIVQQFKSFEGFNDQLVQRNHTVSL